MFNYEVDPSLLSPFVPDGTELDSWHGLTYVSIVGFRFLGTRIVGIPIPFHQEFDEVNLRCYVRRDTHFERRRGVVFIREIVPRRAVAAVARLLYNEPYLALPMRSVIQPGPLLAVSYAWHRAGRWNTLTAQAAPHTRPADGSLEQFIAEHYWGYTRQRNGTTLEYQVTHPPWMVAPADTYRIDAELAGIYGRDFASALRQPASIFLADGSAVAVSSPCPVSPDAAP